MNYLIFDAEKTYNYGYIVVNEKGKVLLRQNLILTNNFENRNIVGENTYKRKKPIYDKDPDAIFLPSADGAKLFAETIIKFDIKQIISHNINEDRRQLEHLRQQTGVTISEIPFYDSINLIKILFPSNTQTNLESIISDITGLDVKQTHTALADCDLLLKLIAPIIEYIPYFINYHEIFAHDNDYEITQKFFTHFNDILPFPADIKDIQSVLNMDTSIGDKRKVTNFIKKVEKNYGLWNTIEGTNNSLTIVENPDKLEDATIIAALYTNLKTIATEVIGACASHQLSLETNELMIEKLNVYKTTYNTEFAKKEEELKIKTEELKKEEKRLRKKELELIEKEKEYLNTSHTIKKPSKATNICKNCGNDIAKSDKYCAVCGFKNTKKPIYKRLWFWIILFIVLGIGSAYSNSDSSTSSTPSQTASAIDKCSRQLEFFDNINANAIDIFIEYVPQFEEKYTGFKSNANKTNSFSLILGEKIYIITTSIDGNVLTIVNNNTGNCIYGNIELESKIKEGFETEMSKNKGKKEEVTSNDKIVIEDSKTTTLGEKNALEAAKDYLDIMAFSKESLKNQLAFAGYKSNEVDYAITNCGADWNKECYEAAGDYLNIMAFSKENLEKQLSFVGFTQSQIDYAMNKIGY